MGFAREVADEVCFLDGGAVLERATPEELFGAPRQARTRQFLRRVTEAGRLTAADAPAERSGPSEEVP
jgi:polar amino acid transport system ATP-binding protein